LQLTDEVRDWYWWIVDRFSFIYNFTRGLSAEAVENLNKIGYKLFSLFNCEQLGASSFPKSAYFACDDIIVNYLTPSAQPPSDMKIEKIDRKIKRELFSLRVLHRRFDIIMAMGTQPKVESALGVFKIQEFEIWLSATQMLDVHINWEFIPAKTQPISEVGISFSSPSTYNIGYPTSAKQKKNLEQQVITILTEIYNNREQITNYINKSHDLLFQLFSGLTTYLLY
jgi:hypothetical protein